MECLVEVLSFYFANSGIIVDFYANWCGPCKVISPIFQKLAEEHTQEGAAEFHKVDIDKIPDVHHKNCKKRIGPYM